MIGGKRRHVVIATALLAGAIGGAGQAIAGGPQAATTEPAPERGDTLVIGKSFDLVTMDPGRMFETTGGMIVPAIYDTLLTFQNNDVSTPMPGLAESWEASEDATEFTFTLRTDAVFSDGTPVEAADVAFSLNRVRELKSSGAFLMEGVTAEAVDASTVRLVSEQPNPALPRILPTPTLGIVNSDVVIENGGTDQVGADADDTAEEFLNATSAGSGPYVLESFSTTGETVIAANPEYVGPNPATFDRIVWRNSDVTTQAIDVQNGNADIVMDLASDQLAPLRGAEGLTIDETSSPTIFFVFANANPEVSEVTSNPDFVEAVRYGLDYAGILELAGEGAVQAPGVIPTHFLGTLAPDLAVQRDVARAQEALARCTVCEGATVQLEYPSDLTVSGLAFQPIAERIVANLEEVGITVELTPGPIATTLENYRAGAEQMGLWLWNPDYPDPQDYLVFGPGALVGLRAGWAEGAAPDIEEVSQQAATNVADDVRVPLFEQFQQMLNESGPIFPLFQPTASVVSVTDRVTGAAFHPTLLLDVRGLAPAG
jgi:peptide/nickel transport system substrate-binding protein